MGKKHKEKKSRQTRKVASTKARGGWLIGVALVAIGGSIWAFRVMTPSKPMISATPTDYYAQLAAAGGVARNPKGPETPFDPSEPHEKKRVHRGGSFLCTEQYCSRYMVGTRGKGEASTGTNHPGFRLVKDAN